MLLKTCHPFLGTLTLMLTMIYDHLPGSQCDRDRGAFTKSWVKTKEHRPWEISSDQGQEVNTYCQATGTGDGDGDRDRV